MENQHRKIKTYRELTQVEIDLMNEGKDLAAKVGEYVEKLKSIDTLDQDSVLTGEINLKQGFMWAIRGVAQPTGF